MSKLEMGGQDRRTQLMAINLLEFDAANVFNFAQPAFEQRERYEARQALYLSDNQQMMQRYIDRKEQQAQLEGR